MQTSWYYIDCGRSSSYIRFCRYGEIVHVDIDGIDTVRLPMREVRSSYELNHYYQASLVLTDDPSRLRIGSDKKWYIPSMVDRRFERIKLTARDVWSWKQHPRILWPRFSTADYDTLTGPPAKLSNAAVVRRFWDGFAGFGEFVSLERLPEYVGMDLREEFACKMRAFVQSEIDDIERELAQLEKEIYCVAHTVERLALVHHMFGQPDILPVIMRHCIEPVGVRVALPVEADTDTDGDYSDSDSD